MKINKEIVLSKIWNQSARCTPGRKRPNKESKWKHLQVYHKHID